MTGNEQEGSTTTSSTTYVMSGDGEWETVSEDVWESEPMVWDGDWELVGSETSGGSSSQTSTTTTTYETAYF